ncbi:hypothetical protein Y5S_00241 [Alcanivorax nanhaiticus]|uniref:Uncharacterized protein n=1 Tax=Alcanivorax nanhaiticus TaxID=1177154 RepID=A0A095SQH0_9GAMM|nr:hypothetical protein Y5S_00241 [Alcanivorax nanhaiticus]
MGELEGTTRCPFFAFLADWHERSKNAKTADRLLRSGTTTPTQACHDVKVLWERRFRRNVSCFASQSQHPPLFLFSIATLYALFGHRIITGIALHQARYCQADLFFLTSTLIEDLGSN